MGTGKIDKDSVESRVNRLWSEEEDRRRVREALASYGLEAYER